MKLFIFGLAILATTAYAQLSSEYLPPAEDHAEGAASSVVETNFIESEPAHSLAEDGYRYRTVKRFRYRHRRDVSTEYLPPHAGAASAAVESYAEPEPSYSAPEPSYSAPAPAYSAPEPAYEAEASAPAHTLSSDGYRYKTVKRLRYRKRRGVSTEYLPPTAGAASATVESYAEAEPSYSAPEPSYSAPAPAFSAPAPSYSAPEPAYEAEASAPAHTLSSDGYRYKTVKRLRYRKRRGVSTEYLPPTAGAASSAVESYAEPEPSYSAPEPSYSAPAPSYSAPEPAYEAEASAPAHTLSSDGYRYKTVKRLRYRKRRGVSTEYLPPTAGAASSAVESYAEPEPSYSAPEPSYSAPAPSYSAPEPAYEAEASAPAHTLSSDGYRYKTVKRLRYRKRRGVSTEYLPPTAGAASSAVESYAEPEPSYSAPEPSYSAPAPSYSAPEPAYEAEASAPAHTLSSDGYRYKTVKRLRYRKRRGVSTEYLPPTAGAASSAVESYAEPEPSYSAPEPSYSAPAPSYSAPEPAYEAEASAPAHTLSSDGYRYKTVKRLRYRKRRGVSTEYLPPTAGAASSAVESYAEPEPSYSAPEPSYSAPAPAYSAPAPSYSAPEPAYEAEASAPAHTLSSDGYRYKTVKRLRYRKRRDVSTEYLPPTAGAASSAVESYAQPEPSYAAPEPSYSAPAPSYSAPEPAYEAEASAPAHTLSSDGYRYKTVKRLRYRKRRVAISPEYLPPQASAASSAVESYAEPEPSYSAPEPSYSAPAPAYSAPAPAYSAPEPSYEAAASEPAHTLASDGYRYKTVKRYRYRHRH